MSTRKNTHVNYQTLLETYKRNLPATNSEQVEGISIKQTQLSMNKLNCQGDEIEEVKQAEHAESTEITVHKEIEETKHRT